MHKKSNKKSSYFWKKGKNVGSLAYFQKKGEKSKVTFIWLHTFSPFFSEKLLMQNANRTTSRFKAHLVYKHTHKPGFLISNAR